MTQAEHALRALEVRQMPNQVQLLRNGQVVICLYHDCPDVTFSKEEALDYALKTAAAHSMLDACEAALVYDKALESCGNDPEKMASFCTAQGDSLDHLYLDWITKARAAIAKATGAV